MPHMLAFDLPVLPEELAGADAARLLRAARDLSAARELARVMEVVRRAARELTGADGVTFVLREGDSVHYADEDAISPLWKGCRFPASACISGWAMIHGETVVIEDIYADPRIPHDAYRPTFVKSLAMVPVGAEDPAASIGAYWARRHRATPREIHLLETLAGFAALALENEALVAGLRLALRAREDFLTIAGHELRTPLTTLQLALGAGLRAAGRGDGAELLGEALTRSERQAQRLASVVTHILEIARITRNELVLAPEELDLAAVAREVVERIRGSGGSISIAGHGPLVGSWDRERIEQVVENLLSNATKFGAGKPVEVAVGRQDGSAVLTVRDHGIGISPEDHARIFERFERAVSARNFSGFGLGLWIVRQNVEAHGGSIAVDSRAGEGSTFTVRLPLPA